MTATHLDHFRLQADEAQRVANHCLDEAGVSQSQRECLIASAKFLGVGVVGEKGCGPKVMYMDRLSIDDARTWAACHLWGVCRSIKEMIDDPYYLNSKLRDQHLMIQWEAQENLENKDLQHQWALIKEWRKIANIPHPQSGIALQKYLHWVEQPKIAHYHHRQQQVKNGKKGGLSKRSYSADIDVILQQVADKIGTTNTGAIYRELAPEDNAWEFGCITDIHEHGGKLWITYTTGEDDNSHRSLGEDALDKRLRKLRKK